MLTAASLIKHPAPNAALAQKARELEGVFLNTLTSAMFSSIKTDGTFGGGFGEETWRGMQSEQLADSISKSGGIGLAEDITRNLLHVQEAAQSPLAPNAASQSPNPQGAYAS